VTLRTYKIINLCLGGVLAFILILPFILNTVYGLNSAQFIQCPYQKHALLCTGCGLTRSVLEIYSGNFSNATLLHTGGPAFVLYIIFQLFLRIVFQKYPKAYLVDFFQSISLWIVLSIQFWF
jgi:hypothetical protein